LKEKEVNKVEVTKQHLYLLMPNNICLSSTQVYLSLGMEQLLKEYEDVFLKDIPYGLPLLGGIEQNTDLIPGSKRPKRYKGKWNNLWRHDGFEKALVCVICQTLLFLRKMDHEGCA